MVTDPILTINEKAVEVSLTTEKEEKEEELKDESGDDESTKIKKTKEIELDAIIYCTGYDSNRFLKTFDVFGKDGMHLQKDVWQEINPYAYKG